MGGWNRSRYVRGHRDRRPQRPPPLPPDYGHENCSVPLWEREFCCYVGNISWQRFCENKYYVGPYNNLDHWDDSGALENFQNAKARFWANYHSQPSHIPLSDPDLYIDKVDQRCKVDPELVADLEKVRLPFDMDNDAATAKEADKKPSQNQSGNWERFIDKPSETNKWESELESNPNATWGEKQEPFSNNWGSSNSGWGDALDNPSWLSSRNNRYQGQSNISGRKRNSGEHFPHRNSKQRNQAEGYQRSGWQQDRRGARNGEWRPVHSWDRQNGW